MYDTMDVATIIFWVVIAMIGFYAINIYNHLVRIKHNVFKAWSNIDVLLKQRHDEIPKLVETCKQYMKFEKETLEKVMQARNQVSAARQSQDIPSLGNAEGMLRMGLGNLFAVAEAIIIARLLNFSARDLLVFAEHEIQDVNVKQLFNE